MRFISVEVDGEIKVDLVFYPTGILMGTPSPIAYFGSAPNTAQLEDHLILQSDLLCSGGESKLWHEGVSCAS